MSKTVEKLNILVANLNVLYRKVQNYHWNVVGPEFFYVHEKLEEFYNVISDQNDEVAERILAIGGRPYGTLKDYLEITNLTEAKNEEIKCLDALKQVKADFEYIKDEIIKIKEVAESEEDFGTSALLDGYLEFYGKNIWMLNSTLK